MHGSLVGTKQNWLDVRCESAMRAKADFAGALIPPPTFPHRERNVATLRDDGYCTAARGPHANEPFAGPARPVQRGKRKCGAGQKGSGAATCKQKTRPVSLKHWRNSRLPTHDSTGAEIEVVMSSRSRLRVAVRTLVRERKVRRRGRRQRLVVAAPR